MSILSPTNQVIAHAQAIGELDKALTVMVMLFTPNENDYVQGLQSLKKMSGEQIVEGLLGAIADRETFIRNGLCQCPPTPLK